MPASGPSPAQAPSFRTGRPNAAKRAGSPLALIAMSSRSAASVSIMRASIGRPPTSSSGLSPPPIRRACPPAKITPATRILRSGEDGEPGASDGTRTHGIQDHNLALYHLSYARHRFRQPRGVGR